MTFNRKDLKAKFKNGSRPSQVEFGDFIDAGIICANDGIQVFKSSSLVLSKNDSNVVNKLNPHAGNEYQIGFGGDDIDTLQFCRNTANARVVLKLTDLGDSANTGTMDVDGLLSVKRRRGSFDQSDVINKPKKPDPKTEEETGKTGESPAKSNSVAGDDSWKEILRTPKMCQAYEVVAQLDHSSNSMLVALAITSTFPNSKKESFFPRLFNGFKYVFNKLFDISNTKIKITQAYSDWFSDRIKIKWVEKNNYYSLQVRANSGTIYYAITCLWDNIYTAGQ